MQEDELIFAELVTNANKKIGIARLNRPKPLNALSLNMLQGLTKQLELWEKDTKIVAVWLESDLEKSFCSGGDLLNVYKARNEFNDDGEYLQNITEYFATEYELDYFIHNYKKPLFAFGRGLVVGGGMGLFQGAKYRLVAENSALAMPETKIGLFPDVGATWFYNKLPLYLTLFLSLTGISVNAKDALDLGLADYYLPQEQKENLLNLLTELNWQDAFETDAKIQEFLSKFKDEITAKVDNQIVPILSDIRNLCAGNLDDIILDNLLSYSGTNSYLLQARDLVAHASPTSLKLTAQLMRNMRNRTLEEALQLDYIITSNISLKGEFVEGIRALIVDKDKKPAWRFKHHNEVTLEWLSSFFELPANYRPLNFRTN